MMHALFGSWPRRIVTAMACLLAFVISLTASLAVSVVRAPDLTDRAGGVPVVGSLAVYAAHRYSPPPPPEERPDIATVRDLRPLSAEEISELIEKLKAQRVAYTERADALEREQKRLNLYRQDLTRERDELLALREQVVNQWEEIKKARGGLDRQVTEMNGIESRNLKQLATSYEAMRPERAAPIVKQLDEGTAAKTLFLMRERNAAKIMEQLDHETAAKLTERMALMKPVN